MIDGTEKPKIPSKFAKHAARYNEFGYPKRALHPREQHCFTVHNSSSLSVFVCYCRQCSDCDPSDDDDEMEVDTEDTTLISQGRQRQVIKEPTKFTPDKGEVRQVASGIHVANYFYLSLTQAWHNRS